MCLGTTPSKFDPEMNKVGKDGGTEYCHDSSLCVRNWGGSTHDTWIETSRARLSIKFHVCSRRQAEQKAAELGWGRMSAVQGEAVRNVKPHKHERRAEEQVHLTELEKFSDTRDSNGQTLLHQSWITNHESWMWMWISARRKIYCRVPLQRLSLCLKLWVT